MPKLTTPMVANGPLTISIQICQGNSGEEPAPVVVEDTSTVKTSSESKLGNVSTPMS